MDSSLGIQYDRSKGLVLEGCVDADWANDTDDRRSQTGYVFLLGGGAISWKSQKQPIVAKSTMEAEYVAASNAADELVWIRNMLKELGYAQEGPTKLYEDNNACIHLAKNPLLNKRSKHIDIKFHAMRELINKKVMEMVKVNSEDNVADTFTKALSKDSFLSKRDKMGLVVTKELKY
jgi:ribosomal protein S24E